MSAELWAIAISFIVLGVLATAALTWCAWCESDPSGGPRETALPIEGDAGGAPAKA